MKIKIILILFFSLIQLNFLQAQIAPGSKLEVWITGIKNQTNKNLVLKNKKKISPGPIIKIPKNTTLAPHYKVLTGTLPDKPDTDFADLVITESDSLDPIIFLDFDRQRAPTAENQNLANVGLFDNKDNLIHLDTDHNFNVNSNQTDSYNIELILKGDNLKDSRVYLKHSIY